MPSHICFSSWLGNVYSLADHEASMQNKHQNDGVELENGVFREETKRNVFVGPALGNPVCHESSDGECRRDRGAFKVF